MELAKLNAIVDKAKSELGAALISCAVLGDDGQVLVGHKPNHAVGAMLSEITGAIKKSLATSDFPSLNKYYLIDMKDNTSIMVMNSGSFEYAMALDMTKLQMGLLMSVVGPQLFEMFQDAVK